MKKTIITLFAIISFCISFISCSNIDSSVNTENNSNSSSNTDNNTNNYPLLKIVSNSSAYYIIRVGLVGYSFEDLRIPQNESKTFELINEIPGGYDNVNVNINLTPVVNKNSYKSLVYIKCNFTKGKTTTITLLDDETLSVSY